ncbi:MAG: hypothetical protein GF418_16040 [Chitinivibrionales bacterium]|nr:hypothetical protein [Chitinivibrionales bacterium]
MSESRNTPALGIICGPQTDSILNEPHAWYLLSVIAVRSCSSTGNGVFAPGEAEIGKRDFLRVGFSERQYRKAKNTLHQRGLVSYRTHQKRTIACLQPSSVIHNHVLARQAAHHFATPTQSGSAAYASSAPSSGAPSGAPSTITHAAQAAVQTTAHQAAHSSKRVTACSDSRMNSIRQHCGAPDDASRPDTPAASSVREAFTCILRFWHATTADRKHIIIHNYLKAVMGGDEDFEIAHRAFHEAIEDRIVLDERERIYLSRPNKTPALLVATDWARRVIPLLDSIHRGETFVDGAAVLQALGLSTPAEILQTTQHLLQGGTISAQTYSKSIPEVLATALDLQPVLPVPPGEQVLHYHSPLFSSAEEVRA